jgi:hypothetical protein
MIGKTCTRCGLQGEEGLFTKGKNVCRPCKNASNAEHRRRNAERIAASGGPRTDGEKACTKCKGVKARELFKHNKNTSDGRDSWCRVCSDAYSYALVKARKAADPEFRAARCEANREYRANMTPEQRQRERERLNAVSDRLLAPQRAAFIDFLLFDHRQHVAEHHAEVKRREDDRVAAKAAAEAARRAEDLPIPPTASPGRRKKLRRLNAVRRATPKWADHNLIKALYDGVREMREITGQPWQVDHIVPLRSPLVCGLHVPANLFPALLEHNARKGNHHWPDKP